MDERTFEDHIRLLTPKLYRTAYAMLWNDADAADAIQDCILKVWRKLSGLRDEACFDAWAMRILIHTCQDARRRGKHQALPLEEASAVAQAEAPVDLELREAIRKLPEKLRMPLLLHHMDGYALEDVSTMLHLPVSTIKGRLYEARKQLKTLLEKEAAR